MYAMKVRSLDGPGALERVEGPPLEPEAGQIVVEPRAIGCNFFDILMCQGRYQKKPPLPFAPGGEVAGVVRRVGSDAGPWAPGDRVLALLDWGGYASEVAVPASRALPLPAPMGFEDAVALGIVYHTAWLALKHRAPLRPGETLLVHAAAGGVGLAAVQLGVAMGARVIGTAGSEDKRALVRAHGAEAALSYRDGDWVDRVRELTGGRGADVVFDPVGGDAFEGSTRCIAWEGRLHVIGFASGRIPSMAMNRVLLKNISLVGLHWGPYLDHDPELVRRAAGDLFDLHAGGHLRPVVSAAHPLEDAATALAALASRDTVGKVLLRP